MNGLSVRTIETQAPRETKTLFWFLFAGTRGAQNRIKIISLLRNTPLNMNQISQELDIDYKGIQHHIRTLAENDLVIRVGSNYGATYFVSEKFEQGQEIFDEILNRLKAAPLRH